MSHRTFRGVVGNNLRIVAQKLSGGIPTQLSDPEHRSRNKGALPPGIYRFAMLRHAHAPLKAYTSGNTTEAGYERSREKCNEATSEVVSELS